MIPKTPMIKNTAPKGTQKSQKETDGWMMSQDASSWSSPLIQRPSPRPITECAVFQPWQELPACLSDSLAEPRFLRHCRLHLRAAAGKPVRPAVSSSLPLQRALASAPAVWAPTTNPNTGSLWGGTHSSSTISHNPCLQGCGTSQLSHLRLGRTLILSSPHLPQEYCAVTCAEGTTLQVQ